jgi:hypothetical protein
MFNLLSLSPQMLTQIFSRKIIIATLVLLSGCLVNGGEQKTYYRTTDVLHIYKAGDFIEYNVYGPSTSANGTYVPPMSGTLHVQWYSTPELTDPLNPTGDTIPVLKEVSTLTINGSTTETVRYISQDTDGTMYLHAFFNDVYYWANETTDTKAPPTELTKVKLWQSPFIATGDNISNTFQVYDHCDNTATPCGVRLGSQTETDKVESSDANIETNLGVFNTFRVSFSGNKQIDPTNKVFPLNLDVRNSCGLGNVNFSGLANVFPEIGVIFMSVSCSALPAGYPSFSYSFEFKRSNISLPTPS